MKENENFVFDESREKHTFYASTNVINEISITEAIQACGGVEEYHWNNEKHLILINKGVVVATLHCIEQSKLAIINLFKEIEDKKYI